MDSDIVTCGCQCQVPKEEISKWRLLTWLQICDKRDECIKQLFSSKSETLKNASESA